MLSIIIPAKNEEKYLPMLLDSIKRQKIDNLEIIVADANSKDKTCEIAIDYGCKVVRGGLLARGRNNGVKYAKGNLLLFIDADIILPEDFLKESLKEFNRRNLDIAGTLQEPTSNRFLYKFIYGIANGGMCIMEKTRKPFMQVCMFCKKNLHQKIGGFDESLIFAEDSEYAIRCVKAGGNFGILKSSRVFISNRRFEHENNLSLILKYIYFNISRFFGKEFRNGGIIKYDYPKYT